MGIFINRGASALFFTAGVLALIILVGFILRVKTYVAWGSSQQFVIGDGRLLGMCKQILVFCLGFELNRMQEFV